MAVSTAWISRRRAGGGVRAGWAGPGVYTTINSHWLAWLGVGERSWIYWKKTANAGFTMTPTASEAGERSQSSKPGARHARASVPGQALRRGRGPVLRGPGHDAGPSRRRHGRQSLEAGEQRCSVPPAVFESVSSSGARRRLVARRDADDLHVPVIETRSALVPHLDLPVRPHPGRRPRESGC